MTNIERLHVGWHKLVPDPSLNFQLNRWAVLGGSSWLADVRPALNRLQSNDDWIEIFLGLGETAERQGRMLDAALHLRSAEFFMLHDDPAKEPLRRKIVAMLGEAYGVKSTSRHDVPFQNLRLPVWTFLAPKSIGTVLVFGGFDGYIEEMFPMLLHMQENEGWSVVAFEGPGQGEVLEEQSATMTPDWHLPVAAVLDALGLDEVTMIGVSLGGCLAMRAAAFEPRVRKVVAFDVMEDLFECSSRQQSPVLSYALKGLMAVGAQTVVDEALPAFAKKRPISQWGLSQAQHVFGTRSAYETMEAMKAYTTRDISDRVTQDVLLMAGAEDHYVPLDQIWRQGKLLSAARSITARVFTAAEDAQAHCQVGNLPLALKTFTSWARSFGGVR